MPYERDGARPLCLTFGAGAARRWTGAVMAFLKSESRLLRNGTKSASLPLQCVSAPHRAATMHTLWLRQPNGKQHKCGDVLVLTRENIKRTLRHGQPGLPRPLPVRSGPGSPAVSVRAADSIVSRVSRPSLDRRSVFAISQTVSPTIAFGGPRRGRRKASRPAASTCRTLNSRGRQTRRRGW
jgi:hypothetical protein